MKKLLLFLFLSFVSLNTSFAIGGNVGDTAKESVDQTKGALMLFEKFFSTAFLLNLVLALGVMIFIFFLSKISTNRINAYFDRSDFADDDSSSREEIAGMVTRTVNIAILFMGASVVFSILGIDVGIFLGGIGLGIGFTLKTFLVNFISGITMVTQGTFHSGDLVEIAGKTGHIVKINALFTQVKQFDGIVFYVPNIKFLEDCVSNYSSNDKRRIELEVGVDYETDIVQAKMIINKVLETFPNILKAPTPAILLTEFGDNALNLKVLFWVPQGDAVFQTRSNVAETINLAFKQAGISIPFPQVTLSNREEFSMKQA